MSDEFGVALIDGDRAEVSITTEGYEVEIIEGDPIEVAVFAEGIPGAKGDQGDPGPTGPPGGDLVYEHIQDVAANIWTIVHNLGVYPNVALVDTLGREFNAEVQYDSPNQVTIFLAIAGTGKAYLS